MMIEVNNLQKSYDGVAAVKGISFNVSEGALFSFLGTNGAGKSTTINILTTLLAKSGGDAKIDGFCVDTNSHEVRNRIGIVFQDGVLDKELTVRENLMIRGSLYGKSLPNVGNAVTRAIELTGMHDYENRLYGKLSGGQKRRADIARALLHTPKLLFLDEPTTGLDPKTRRDIWELIRSLQKEHQMTVFLTTHYMEEAADSDDIAIIHQGSILAQGTPAELKAAYGHDTLRLTLNDGTQLEHKLETTTEALPIIDQHRDNIVHVEIVSGTLDEVFLNLTGGNYHAG